MIIEIPQMVESYYDNVSMKDNIITMYTTIQTSDKGDYIPDIPTVFDSIPNFVPDFIFINQRNGIFSTLLKTEKCDIQLNFSTYELATYVVERIIANKDVRTSDLKADLPELFI